jgi:hypothetical protein
MSTAGGGRGEARQGSPTWRADLALQSTVLKQYVSSSGICGEQRGVSPNRRLCVSEEAQLRDRSMAGRARSARLGSLQAQKEALLLLSYCALAVEEVTSQHGFSDQRFSPTVRARSKEGQGQASAISWSVSWTMVRSTTPAPLYVLPPGTRKPLLIARPDPGIFKPPSHPDRRRQA